MKTSTRTGRVVSWSRVAAVALAAMATAQCEERRPEATAAKAPASSSKPAGAPCGGAAAKACPEGQLCVRPQHKGGLELSDGGHCAGPGAEGTPCGAPDSPSCQTGLSCVAAHPPPKRCRRPGTEGASCGGAVGRPCLEGLACVLGADERGVCRRPKGPCGKQRCGADEICCDWDQGRCVGKDEDVDCK